MSDEVYTGSRLTVVRLVGPENEGSDRRRWEFTVFESASIVAQTRLDAAAVTHLLHALALSALWPLTGADLLGVEPNRGLDDRDQ